MFQRELLYAAGGGLHLAGRGTGGSGASCRPAGDASGPADRITFAGGCSRRTGLPDRRETGTSRLQTHRSGRENPGRTGKKDLPDLPKILLPVWAIGRRFPPGMGRY